eukprot:GHVH01009956.1.p1 GENE.GHVH01009956.1~~GHVH01009956.1.p1  ORF type:complete len:345 (+),score=51.97 GHVH01009956.1:517-1551(+)
MVSKIEMREEIFEAMMNTPGLFYAAVEISPETIDQMNILNASLFGMSLVTCAVLSMVHAHIIPIVSKSRKVRSAAPMLPLWPGIEMTSGMTPGTEELVVLHYPIGERSGTSHAAMLCDGDKVPYGAKKGTDNLTFEMAMEQTGQRPIEGWLVNQWRERNIVVEALSCVKGDATHRSIASASIVAKVLRDRKMVEFVAEDCLHINDEWGRFTRAKDGYVMEEVVTIAEDVKDPYDVVRNKGYPTPIQIKNVSKYGASAHHRLSFRPIIALLKDDQLRMPTSIAPRALSLLEEFDRRDKLTEDRRSQRKRTPNNSLAASVQKRSKPPHEVQMTLTKMFQTSTNKLN